jgi:hypothetical protein
MMYAVGMVRNLIGLAGVALLAVMFVVVPTAQAAKVSKSAAGQSVDAGWALVLAANPRCKDADPNDGIHCRSETEVSGNVGHCPRVAAKRWRCVLRVDWSLNQPTSSGHCFAPVFLKPDDWKFPLGQFRCPLEWYPEDIVRMGSP